VAIEIQERALDRESAFRSAEAGGDKKDPADDPSYICHDALVFYRRMQGVLLASTGINSK
jgi:hypothetical protein